MQTVRTAYGHYPEGLWPQARQQRLVLPPHPDTAFLRRERPLVLSPAWRTLPKASPAP